MIKSKLKTVFLSSLGGGLEYYDFVIFAIFAKSIGANFFPATSELATLIQSYTLFAIGYLIRPLGGLVFSHFGDRYGRKKSFSFSISLMAISTLLMSFLPNFEQIGIWATFLFIILRIFQGFSIGGEIPGALTFVSEHVPKQKGAACAVILLFLNCGILVGDLVFELLSSNLPADIFYYYGWRIAFFIGGLLALVSFYIRLSLKETDSFLSDPVKYRFPLIVLIKSHSTNLIKVFCLAGASASVTSIFLLYFNSYAQTILKLSINEASRLSFYQLIVFMIFSAIASLLTDKFGCKKILRIFSFYLILGPMIVFYLVNMGFHITLALIVNAIGIGFYSGAMPCYLSELFPVSVRYSGIAMGYNLGFAIFGGLSPLVSSLLVGFLKFNEAPALIIIFSGFIAFLSLLPSQKKNMILLVIGHFSSKS